VRSPQFRPVGQPETLADVLAWGPLSLAAGLRCAIEIATELRDLHQATRAYGKLTPASVILTQSGAHLLPLRDCLHEALPEGDVQAFGALFYQMLAGTAPPATLTAADIRVHGPRAGPARVRPAAMKLALKCLAPEGTALTMQRVATEIRLLGLLLRQYGADPRRAEEPLAASTPFLVRAAPPAAAPPIAFSSGAAPPVAPEIAHSMQPAETVTGKNLAAGGTGAVPVVPLEPDSFGHPKPKPPAEREPAGGNCPKCDSPAVYVSRARSRFELMLENWNVPICRCHRCYHRYVVFARFKFAKEMPVGTRRKVKRRRSQD
jgi:hypothetical protein